MYSCAYHKGVCGVEGQLLSFLTSALGKSQWSASNPWTLEVWDNSPCCPLNRRPGWPPNLSRGSSFRELSLSPAGNKTTIPRTSNPQFSHYTQSHLILVLRCLYGYISYVGTMTSEWKFNTVSRSMSYTGLRELPVQNQKFPFTFSNPIHSIRPSSWRWNKYPWTYCRNLSRFLNRFW
jgi:hypothetical protein